MAAPAPRAKSMQVRLVQARAVQARIVLMTAGSEEQATRIARVLVDEGLAACVNVVGPIRSIYRWRHAVEDQGEYLLLAKTRAALYARLEQRVKQLHSYELPEVLAISPSSGSARYLEWIAESTRSESENAAARRAPGKKRRTGKVPPRGK